MKYITDTHTHTIASGHAYSTMMENIDFAKGKGLKLLATTDHGPACPGAPNMFWFGSMKCVPRMLNGIIHLNGVECNIMNTEGELDLPDKILKKLDIVIISLHDFALMPSGREENTEALLNAMNNPHVQILGHLGNPKYPIYEEEVIKKAKEKNILVEINCSSEISRPGSKDNCIKIARLAGKHGVKMVISSDAHFMYSIGNFDLADEILDFDDIDESLILSSDEKKVVEFFQEKGKLEDISL